MVTKKIFCSITALLMCCVVVDGFAATKATKQSAIQNGTKVTAKGEVKGIYNQECYDAYYGCMNEFCITDNTDGGSCACSDDFTNYEKRLADIKDTLERAEKISTEEVERIEAGANADIIFNGVRTYDEKGNIGESEADKKAKKRESLLAMFNTSMEEDDDDYDDYASLKLAKSGSGLLRGAHDLCVGSISSEMGDTCDKDIPFLEQLYSRQIIADCKALENTVVAKESESKQKLLAAESAVRSALKDSLKSANKYDRGECMVEYKKCMQKEEACGTNWEHCVSEVAFENMQNDTAVSTAKTKFVSVDTYNITEPTMKILDSKRYICERVLESCVAVRDMVWDDFLREAAPTIRLAESRAESKKRQSCLTDISECIQSACKSKIGNGVESMDACLAYPEIARSSCKMVIEPCERMESTIWNYVQDKLAALRVDACTTEVKNCFTDETRCGSDFSKCIGMDFDYIHEMCPLDTLITCKEISRKNGKKFEMSDLDSMLMGLYLNIDNSLLEDCQNLVEQKMTEVCGSTTDCNRFAGDEVLGSASLRSQKNKDVYRVTGMISFGSIKMGDASGKTKDGNGKLEPGQIGVADYIENVRAKNTRAGDEDIIVTIEEELNNIAGTINRTIEMIENDPQIQFCVSGRDLGQITGDKGDRTEARFPNLLNSVKMQIAVSALRKAQDNYNDKFTELVAKATKDASADIAQYMCQMMPMNNGGVSYMGDVKTELVPPYSISYDVGTGLTNDMLTMGGHNQSATGTGGGINTTAAKHTDAGDVIGSILSLGWNQMIANNNVSIQTPSGTREMWSVFNREDRICHYCTSTVTKSCTTIHKNGFLGIGQKDEQSCTESEPYEHCEDIEM